MFNTATAIGPAVSGLVYAAVGPAWCFTINGLSFLAVIVALMRMKIEQVMPKARRDSALRDIRAGFGYVGSQTVVRTVILFILVVSLFGLSFTTLMPAWSVNVLGGGAITNGYLQSARDWGVGGGFGAGDAEWAGGEGQVDHIGEDSCSRHCYWCLPISPGFQPPCS